ncbi:MAG: molybdopterin-synthase adenylyltransferase MoeB [Candidatus Thiodiazotropha sp.]
MSDEQLLRYSRQIMLPSIGIEGQQRLHESRVLIVGLGGLGSPVALYLAAAGVGELVLADFDRVDLTNLQRQIIHKTADIGRLKVESARDTLSALNPEVRVETLAEQLDESRLDQLIRNVDLVIEGSDNFATRFAVNRVCRALRVPLVSGAAIRMEGQVSVFTGQPGSPCYQCLYPDEGAMDETCSANGVLAPLVGIIGSIQATEAIKQLTGAGRCLDARLLLLDALQMEWRSLKLKPDPACPVCGQSPP